MKRKLIYPIALLLVVATWNCKDCYSSITLTTGSTYTQDFDTLASSGSGHIAVPTDWAFSDNNGTYEADDGNDNAGGTKSYGTRGSSERAFGSLASGSTSPILGAEFSNGDAQDLLSVGIRYTGEHWRGGAVGGVGNQVDTLAFEYSTDATSLTTGTWTPFTNLDYTNAPTPLVGELDGNATTTAIASTFTFGTPLSNGSTFWIRWQDSNDAGSDGGLGIDDFSASGTFAIPEPTTFLMFGTLALGGLAYRRRK